MLRRSLPFVTLVTLAVTACSDLPDRSSPVAPPAEARPETAPPIPRQQEIVPGRVLVRFGAQAPEQQIVTQEGAAIVGGLDWIRVRVLSVPVGAEARIAAALAANPAVEFAEPDVFMPFGPVATMPVNDPYLGYKWDLDNDGTITNSAGALVALTGAVDADMDWKEAVQLHPSAPGTARIGILDTGIRLDHQEFTGRIAAARGFTGNTTGSDDHGHGSHVAGIAAARANNGAGVAGVAYAGNIQLVIAKVCGTFGCPSTAIADGIRWAVDQGADVLNLSLGGSFPSSTQQAALQYARANGVLPFCASGNDNGAVSYPAAFPECVAVGATDWSDSRASYSNYGSQVELSAPGGDSENPQGYSYILSAYNSGPSSYAFMAGTSMATPQVVGAAALLKAFDPTLTDGALLQVLKATADDLGPAGRDDAFGSGRINVAAAVAAVAGGSPPPPNSPPTADFDDDCTDLTCAFTDRSSDSDGSVVSWSWDFGDGGTSTERNPTHTYASAGTYTVSLTVRDDDDAAAGTSHPVTVTEPPAGNQPPTAAFTEECTALTCQFTDGSSDPDGNVVAWSWSFGDGATSSTRNPSHTYPAGGTYLVQLTVVDDGGATDAVARSVTVTEPPAGGITLTASGSKVKGSHVIDLFWSGATGATVDLYRNGSLITTTPNDGVHRDVPGGKGKATYRYQLCEAGSTSVCSGTVTVVF